MKKYLKMLLCAALSVGAFTACEDVPEPYNLPTNQGGDTPSIVEPAGDGTLKSPFNVTACLALVKEMEADVESDQAYYIKGIVASNTTTDATISQYGNMTFTMYDEGNPSNTFTAFQVYGPGNKRFTSVDQIKVGDEVIVYGKVVNYRGNTPETVGKGQAYVYSINSSGGDTPSEGIEVTCAEAVELTKKLADGGTSAETYTVTGYITEVVGSVSRDQQTFWMADTKDGGRVFEAYWANLPEGVSEFKVGSKVKITGQLIKYVNATSGQVTPEIKNANVEILEEGSGGGGGSSSGTPAGSGTKEDPYNVAAAVAGSGNAWVSGYIVGWIEGQVLSSGAKFSSNASVATNILIADSPDETDVANCMPVQLPAGEVRSFLLELNYYKFYEKTFCK